MKVSALTCSTGRPEALALCRKYVARQTRPVDEHVVQEGGDFWTNMRAGLERVTGDLVVIFEDDDWYAADWVERCVAGLADADLFGQLRICNYHVRCGGIMDSREGRANCPLHATAFHARMRERLFGLPWGERKPRLDVSLWALDVRKQTTLALHVVSMKGMPGTAGYSVAHSPRYYRRFDRDGSLLRSLIGEEDARVYAGFRCSTICR